MQFDNHGKSIILLDFLTSEAYDLMSKVITLAMTMITKSGITTIPEDPDDIMKVVITQGGSEMLPQINSITDGAIQMLSETPLQLGKMDILVVSEMRNYCNKLFSGAQQYMTAKMTPEEKKKFTGLMKKST